LNPPFLPCSCTAGLTFAPVCSSECFERFMIFGDERPWVMVAWVQSNRAGEQEANWSYLPGLLGAPRRPRLACTANVLSTYLMSHAPKIHGLVRRIRLWICDAPSRLMAQLLQLWPIRGESTDKVGDTRLRRVNRQSRRHAFQAS